MPLFLRIVTFACSGQWTFPNVKIKNIIVGIAGEFMHLAGFVIVPLPPAGTRP
jgi:hypothetical protein